MVKRDSEWFREDSKEVRSDPKGVSEHRELNNMYYVLIKLINIEYIFI